MHWAAVVPSDMSAGYSKIWRVCVTARLLVRADSRGLI